MTEPWLYISDAKFSGIGIDLVCEQQIRAFSEAERRIDVLARGCLELPQVRNFHHPLPATKLFSWLPSQKYYALNKRYFSYLGNRRFRRGEYSGVVAWSKTAIRPFESAARRGIPRLLNVGNSHRDFDSGRSADHNLDWPLIPHSRYREEYELASLILVASDQAAQSFISQGIPAEKIRTIYRGADTTKFFPPPHKQSDTFIVASCGLLGERKGTYQLLRAWRRLALPHAELWLIGHLPEAESKAIRSCATANVRFLGFRKDLPELLRKVHLHVLLSRNEGLAKVLLEAGASGVPNLCSYQAGLPSDAAGTLFVEDRDSEAGVADALESCYRDREGTARLGSMARRMVEERFSWAAFRSRFMQAVRNVQAA
jgi:glycosyltransferase involved in cell wall biosynthesis